MDEYELSVDSIAHEPDPTADQPEAFPFFRIRGKLDGADFECKIGVELDGRDADYEHASGVDFQGLEDQPEIQNDLYEKVYETDEYKALVQAYNPDH